jgi:5-methylcytosine-specific restriction endonuclease McrA
MKHISNYCKYFGIAKDDWVPSELSGTTANHFHHIIYRSQEGSDEVENIIALSDDEHKRAHFLKQPYLHKEELQEAHNIFMEQHKKAI